MGWYEVGDISYILEPSGDKMEQQSLFLSKDLRREGEGDSKDKDLPPPSALQKKPFHPKLSDVLKDTLQVSENDQCEYIFV